MSRSRCRPRRSRLLGRLTAVVLVALAWTATVRHAEAHPFHGSIAEAEYRPDGKVLEVALRVHPEDLESALSRMAGRGIDIEKSKGVDDLILGYLEKCLEFRSADRRPARLKWVGKEVSVKWAWLYFEVPLPEGLDGCTIRNRILMDVVDDQVNTINFRIGTRRESLRFTPAASKREFPAGGDG